MNIIGDRKMTIDRLAADLFVSELMLNKMLGGKCIRQMNETGVIDSHRELFHHNLKEIDFHMENRLSELDREKIKRLIKRKVNRDVYIERAQRCLEANISSVSKEDNDYPASFRSLDGMPIILYCRGNRKYLNMTGRVVSVVGSRQPSNYGIRAASEICTDLVNSDVVIVSGLARGIDTVAHRAALDNKGKTIAVMACGLDLVYPPENAELYESIIADGLAVSEMPPGQKALRQYFPARNRIMSALSDIVAIVEAGQFSGTLHTASFAAAQGRDVFVLPGSIYSPHCKGNLMLLQDGADLMLCAGDILARLAGISFAREYDEIRLMNRKRLVKECLPDHPEKLTKEEIKGIVFEELGNGEMTMDELVESAKMPFEIVAPLISELMLEGQLCENQQRFALTFPYT